MSASLRGTVNPEPSLPNETVAALRPLPPPSAKLVAKPLEYENRTQSKLAHETPLANRTVREALNQLEDAGIVTSRPSVDGLVIAEDANRVGPRRRAIDDDYVVVLVPEVLRTELWVVDAGDGVAGEHLLDVHAASCGEPGITARYARAAVPRPVTWRGTDSYSLVEPVRHAKTLVPGRVGSRGVGGNRRRDASGRLCRRRGGRPRVAPDDGERRPYAGLTRPGRPTVE